MNINTNFNNDAQEISLEMRTSQYNNISSVILQIRSEKAGVYIDLSPT